MVRLTEIFGWNKFPDDSTALLENIKRGIIIFPHSSGWDQTISYIYAKSDENFATVASRFKLIVTMDIKIYEDFARRHFFNNMIFLKKGGNYKDIIDQLETTPEWLLAISPKGAIKKKEWRSGWFNIAKHFNVPLIVMGPDYDRHEIKVVGEPIYIGDRTYEEIMEEAKKRFGEIIPLYADTEFGVTERPSQERFVIPESVRLFYTLILLVVLLAIFIFLIRKDIMYDGRRMFYWSWMGKKDPSLDEGVGGSDDLIGKIIDAPGNLINSV